MKNLIIAVAILALFAGMAVARGPMEKPMVPYEGQRPQPGTQIFYDDMETGAPGWTHFDASVPTAYWHIDSYMAYSGSSWWCGTFNYDTDGGYGNNWAQYLETPYLNLTVGTPYPVVRYQYRNDTESGFDFSFCEAESNGVFVPLNRGYDGVHPWSFNGHYIGNKDNPAKIRFAFYSDGGYSDADGYYSSVGGAFAVDNVEVWDNQTYEQFFYDDADANVNLIPITPPSSGDYWSIRSDLCHCWSPTHYWGVQYPDTTFCMPMLDNWLLTPTVDINPYAPATSCTLSFIYQQYVTLASGGNWQELGTNDGGATWYVSGWWYGDQCGAGYNVCDHFRWWIPLTWPGNFGTGQVRAAWRYFSDVDGIEPASCNYSGLTIDDVYIYVYEPPSPVEESSWGKIKSMYK
jgi:hypothetical protein